MVNADTAVRRVLILASLSIALIATVTFLSITANAKASAVLDPAAPMLNEAWVPANNSNIIFTGSARLVAYMSLPTMEPFTITNLSLKVIVPGAPPVVTFYPATYSILPDYSFGVVTATNFPFTIPGEQAQFLLTYYSASNPVPTTASAIYNVSGVYRAYFPSALNRYGIGANAGNDPCTAANAAPLTDYMTLQDSPHKFYSLNVPTNSTLFMTVTNYPLTGQMQLRTPPAYPSCATTGTLNVLSYSVIPGTPSITAYNIPAGTYMARFSSDAGATSTTPFTFRWQYVPASGLNEPNNSPCEAIAVSLNTKYQDYPEDNEDWFAFDIAATQNFSIAVNNYTGTGGQVQLLRQATTCQNIAGMQLVDLAGFASGSASIPTVTLTPARYYLRVYTGGGFNTTNLYDFTIYTVVDTWNPIANRCTAWVNCNDHAIGDTETIYWAGAPGAAEIKVEFNPQVAKGSCPVGNYKASTFNAGSNPTVDSLTPVGNYTFSGLSNGYYIVRVTISRPGFTTYAQDMGVKVNCDFLLFAQSPWPGSLTTPGAPVIGPVQPQAVKPTPVPLPMDLPGIKVTPAP